MNRQKTIVQETSRWFRVGTLALTVLGPVVDALVSRVRSRTPTPRESIARNTNWQEKVPQRAQLVAIGDALSQVLQDLKEYPYSQELLKRAEDLTGDLQERIRHLSLDVVERGSQITRDIGRRGNQATYQLAARGSRVSHKLAKHSERLSKDLARRSRRASKTEENDSTFWTIAGFALGLLAAGGVAYFFVRRRIQHKSETEQFELAQPGRLSSYRRPGEAHAPYQNTFHLQPYAASAGAAVADPEAHTLSAIPGDARIVGITSTNRYYPVETARDLLAQGKLAADLEVVYFLSETEAETAGFSGAE